MVNQIISLVYHFVNVKNAMSGADYKSEVACMCTAVSYQTKDHYFGRNLDLECSRHETVTITPRNYPLRFRCVADLARHYAMIGMAYVKDDYPLYCEATNEAGLSMAGLNFPGNAYYSPKAEGKDNVSPFEFIPWILGQCADLEEAKDLLSRINPVDIPFSEQLPLTPLHWMLADKTGCLTVECVREGVNVYDNPVKVLTNNPPFDIMLFRLNDYMHLTNQPPVNRFGPGLELAPYSRGMGAMGLPGDLSSASRFVRAAFTRWNSVSGESEAESVSQFFHILGSVEQQRGCVQLPDGSYEMTVYSCCCNTDKGIYYYTTYENRRITAVDMRRENLDGHTLVRYPLIKEQEIRIRNKKTPRIG